MTFPQAVLEALYEYDDDRLESAEAAFEVPAEGQEVQIPYKGSVLDSLHRIRGHLQSAVSYADSESLAQACAKILPHPLQYLIPLSAAVRAESYER